jgi:hypothetical protein
MAADAVQRCSTEAAEIAVGLSGAVVCDLVATNKSCAAFCQRLRDYITVIITYPETVFLTVRVKVASFNTPAAVGLNWNVTPGAQVKGVVGTCWYFQFPEQATEPLGKATVKSMVELNLELSGQVPPGKPELLPMKWRSRLGTVHDSERVVRGRARAVERRARDEKRVVACMFAYFQVYSVEELWVARKAGGATRIQQEGYIRLIYLRTHYRSLTLASCLVDLRCARMQSHIWIPQ